MTGIEKVLSCLPFSLGREEKKELFTRELISLTERHYRHCIPYRRILDALGINPESLNSYTDVPFLPISLFKEFDLLSVACSEVIKTMTSSGTTGQAVSKIYIDRETASNQQKALVEIVSDFLGASRLPMIIIDSPSVVKDRKMFSARGAGILGFSIFGADRSYALDDDMKLDVDGISAFLEKHKGRKILLFGFTFMVWQHFYKELVKNKPDKLDLSQGILLHGGGWKKLTQEAVSQEQFAQMLFECCGLRHIHDYYGMVEQTGSIYMQCGEGHLHASIYSDIIVRDHMDFSICPIGKAGIIQVMSLIPGSYPGHSLLTEDEGMLLGEDDCPCGRLGKYFKINGRLKNSEIRGCSDTYASAF